MYRSGEQERDLGQRYKLHLQLKAEAVEDMDEMAHSTWIKHEKNLGKKEPQEKKHFKDRLKRI